MEQEKTYNGVLPRVALATFLEYTRAKVSKTETGKIAYAKEYSPNNIRRLVISPDGFYAELFVPVTIAGVQKSVLYSKMVSYKANYQEYTEYIQSAEKVKDTIAQPMYTALGNNSSANSKKLQCIEELLFITKSENATIQLNDFEYNDVQSYVTKGAGFKRLRYIGIIDDMPLSRFVEGMKQVKRETQADKNEKLKSKFRKYTDISSLGSHIRLVYTTENKEWYNTLPVSTDYVLDAAGSLYGEEGRLHKELVARKNLLNKTVSGREEEKERKSKYGKLEDEMEKLLREDIAIRRICSELLKTKYPVNALYEYRFASKNKFICDSTLKLFYVPTLKDFMAKIESLKKQYINVEVDVSHKDKKELVEQDLNWNIEKIKEDKFEIYNSLCDLVGQFADVYEGYTLKAIMTPVVVAKHKIIVSSEHKVFQGKIFDNVVTFGSSIKIKDNLCNMLAIYARFALAKVDKKGNAVPYNKYITKVYWEELLSKFEEDTY